MAEEDDLDTEALQAQIDLSMSFAQNLVASWMKPSTSASTSKKSSSQNLEDELKDYMRRPARARLGVGAPLPDTGASSSREAARLKGQLLGKGKRRREGEDEELKKTSGLGEEDDERESRAGAIKKKARLDPFGGPSGSKAEKKKKKKAEINGIPTPQSTPNPSQQNGVEGLGNDAGANETTRDTSIEDVEMASPHISAAQKPRKKKKRKPGAMNESAATNGDAERSIPQPTPPATSNNRQPIELPGGPPVAEIATVPQTPSKVVDISLFATPNGLPSPPGRDLIAEPLPKHTSLSPILSSKVIQSRRGSISASLLQQPVLNLDGPVNDDDEEDAVSPSTSPSKKRKRRKKKKRSMAPDSSVPAVT